MAIVAAAARTRFACTSESLSLCLSACTFEVLGLADFGGGLCFGRRHRRRRRHCDIRIGRSVNERVDFGVGSFGVGIRAAKTSAGKKERSHFQVSCSELFCCSSVPSTTRLIVDWLRFENGVFAIGRVRVRGVTRRIELNRYAGIDSAVVWLNVRLTIGCLSRDRVIRLII